MVCIHSESDFCTCLPNINKIQCIQTKLKLNTKKKKKSSIFPVAQSIIPITVSVRFFRPTDRWISPSSTVSGFQLALIYTFHRRSKHANPAEYATRILNISHRNHFNFFSPFLRKLFFALNNWYFSSCECFEHNDSQYSVQHIYVYSSVTILYFTCKSV